MPVRSKKKYCFASRDTGRERICKGEKGWTERETRDWVGGVRQTGTERKGCGRRWEADADAECVHGSNRPAGGRCKKG